MTAKKDRRLNILFSTTRGWNCGDDFILYGVRNLLSNLDIEFNPVIYNRNPDVCPHLINFDKDINFTLGSKTGKHNASKLLQEFSNKYDNSWRRQHPIDFIDYVIFAGTPEWPGIMVQPLVQALSTKTIPTAYLGIGIYEGTSKMSFADLPSQDQSLLNSAKLITVRDSSCQKLLQKFNPTLLSCPALFAVTEEKVVTQKKKLVFSLQGSDTNNGQDIPSNTLNYFLSIIDKLKDQYDCAVVLHYIDELEQFSPLFNNELPIFYSYDPLDYIGIYRPFDLAITTRVHGAGLCASLGIPSFVISHSDRSETCKGFLSKLIKTNTPLDSLVKQIEQTDIQDWSSKIVQHKKDMQGQYLTLLENFLAKP